MVKNSNKMKISNMPDKKFKETAIRMINKFESGKEDSDSTSTKIKM